MQGAKIAIGGKGGVGKTTVCAVWAQLFAQDGFDVLAIDADPTTNLASAFGIPSRQNPEPLIKMKQLIAERTGTGKDAVGAYFKLNPKVSDLPQKHWVEVNGVKLLVLGAITQAGGGCACPEGTFLKALLTHTILQRQEMVLVDLAAGVESMGRASVQGVDAFVVIVEPGSRSIETANNVAKMARELGIKNVAAIANKITDTSQTDVIQSQLKGVALLGSLAYSRLVQEADLGFKPVFSACPELVGALTDTKDKLVDLVNTGQQQVEMQTKPLPKAEKRA
ncbi:MAG: ATP-binding protein [Planctomycetota bacterium]|jgi:CO dehydrogenase maturation factor